MENNAHNDQVLSSWKEIAAFFGKGVRTVQRWEHELQLPVRRPHGSDKKIVLARTADLARWMGKQPASGHQVALQESMERVQRMRDLLLSMQLQTERLQSNTTRFLENYSRLSTRDSNPRSHRRAS